MTSRQWEMIWLGIATAVWLAAAPAAGVAAILSPMVFDPSENLFNPAAWLAFLLIVSGWAVCLAAPYGAWVAFFRDMKLLSWTVMAAPLVWLAAAVASATFIPG